MKFNKVMLGGNLTRDPELRYTSDEKPVLEIGLAVNNPLKEDDVLFLDVTVWGKQAENCQKYLKKGSSVFIEGRLRLNTWEDKDSGQKRSKVTVTAETVQFLDKKPAE